jgi:hypothetical protein
VSAALVAPPEPAEFPSHAETVNKRTPVRIIPIAVACFFIATLPFKNAPSQHFLPDDLHALRIAVRRLLLLIGSV